MRRCYVDFTPMNCERMKRAHKRVEESIEGKNKEELLEKDKRKRCSHLFKVAIDRKDTSILEDAYPIPEKNGIAAYTIDDVELRSIHIKLEDCY